MKTMIVSAFPACGKTYLFRNQEKLGFKIADTDSSKFTKHEGWEKGYVDHIVTDIGSYDFIFCSRSEHVLRELFLRGIPFVVVAPNNVSELKSDNERLLIKQQWFGRFILRDTSHIKNLRNWLNRLYSNYDEWTSWEHLNKFTPVSIFLLEQNQYLSSIIHDLYWKKENHDIYVAARKQC